MRFFGLTVGRIILFWLLSATATLFDGFGMAMFLPVLEFVEKAMDVTALASQSPMWDKLIRVFNWVGVKISLLSLLTVAVGTVLCRVVLIYARQIYSAWLSQQVLHTVRSKLMTAYLNMNYGTFARHPNGAVINILTTEAQRVGGGFSSLLSLISNTVVVLCFLLVLMWLSILMTLFAALFLSLAGVIVLYYMRHTRKCSNLVHAANDTFSRMVLERLGAFRLVKLTGTVHRESEKISLASGSVRDTNYWMTKLQSRVDLLLEPLVLLAGGVILYFAVSQFGMTLSQLGLFMLILLRLMPLSKELLRSRQAWVGSLGSFDAVLRDLDWTRAHHEGRGGRMRFEAVRENIHL